jgi:hypothetical protein
MSRLGLLSSVSIFAVAMLLFVNGCTNADQVQESDEIPATISDQADDLQKGNSGGNTSPEKDLKGSGSDKADASADTLPSPIGEAAPAVEDVDLATQLRKEKEEFNKQSIEIPESWTRLGKDSHIWADKKNKQVIVRGIVCLREGMFACPRGTKEHESIVSVHAKSSEIHASLLALGIDNGKPMDWREVYQPATGPIMEIEVWWNEDGKIQKRRMQEMLKENNTGKATEAKFVFGGSEIYVDPETKVQTYYADSGEMINVANSPYAMIDVAIESSMEAEKGLMFSALTENIPEVNTKVYLVISANGHTDDGKKPQATDKQEGKSQSKNERTNEPKK